MKRAHSSLALLMVLAFATPSAAELDTAIMPVPEIRSGMKGYGLTVFKGTKIERFSIEIVDVIRNFLPKQDMILIRCGGLAAADKFNVAAGMSGSPIYVDGKLIGALAYGWTFMNESLAGVTPIGAMVDGTSRPTGKPTSAPRSGGLTDRVRGLRPLRAPLLVSGVHDRALAELERQIAPYNLRAMRSGGSGTATTRPELKDLRLEPGSSCFVELMRGDVGASILGTVTALDGKRVYAFGHSFFDSGERRWPLGNGWINYTFGSTYDGFKMGESGVTLGALTQDRQAGVAGELGLKTDFFPARVTVTNAVSKRSESYDVEILNDRDFSAQMIGMLASSALARSEGSSESARVDVVLRATIRGRDKPVIFRDTIASRFGPSLFVATSMVSRILGNPFREVALERVEIDVVVRHENAQVNLAAATFDRAHARPGEAVEVTIRMRRRLGDDHFERMRIVIPKTAPVGQALRIVIQGGDNVSPDVPAARDLEGIIAIIEGFHPSTDLVAEIQVPGIDVDTGSGRLRDLPASALEALLAGTGRSEITLSQSFERTVKSTKFAVSGSLVLTLPIVSPESDPSLMKDK